MSFHYKRSLQISYFRQGYIYFTSQLYRYWPKERRREIRKICRESAGQYWQAVLEFVTTDAGATKIALKHHLSERTLYRMVSKYYQLFNQYLV